MNANKKVSFSIKITIFTLFSSFTLVIMGLVITLSYIRNSSAALIAAEQLMNQNVQQVFMKIENMYEPLLNITDQASELPIFGEKPTLQNHPAETYLINSIDAYPQIQILYIGYDDGDFYQILSFKGESRDILLENVRAPVESEYAILRQYTPEGHSKPVRLWKYLNPERQTIGSRKEAYTGYDPRRRPWFINARKTDKSVKTDPYFFSNTQQTGITISRNLDGTASGVIGADILLNEMTHFLSEIKGETKTCLYIFNKQDKVTALSDDLKIISRQETPSKEDFSTPSLEEIDHPLIRKFIQYKNDNSLKPVMDFNLNSGKDDYLVKIRKLPERYGNEEFLFMARPRNDILGPILKTMKTTSVMSLLILILALPVILIISGMISAPINRLVFEANKIGNFELEEDILIRSSIRETRRLTEEMASMKRGLRQFNKYVPSRLVRDLLHSETESRIGGKSREMTFFFSDIANFTGISENIPAEKLMKRLSCYFDILTGIIRDCNGTVDKYIGDAVMAFWNAPHNDPDHIKNACIAAINIQNKLAVSNRIWKKNGQNPFYTRIGLHTGEAVVGNVGSRERLNYTVIGDVVNVSSRFESLNKIYGTGIIAGESVIRHLEDEFIYRPLEKIIVKGKSKAELVYELIAIKSETDSSQIEFASSFSEAYSAYLNRSWESAEKLFRKAAAIKPNDIILTTYLENISRFKTNEPKKEWSGIRIMKVK